MNLPTEIVPDVWLLRSESGQWNCGIVHNERDVLLVDPGPLGQELGMLESFLKDTERQVVAIVATHTHGAALPADKWPDVPRVEPGTASTAMRVPFLPGWQVMMMPGEGRLGLYSPGTKILFCGDLLTDLRSAVPVPVLAGGVENYLEALETLEKLDAKLIVPAAGSTARGKRAIRERIEHDRNYTYSVVRHLQSTVSAQVGLETALQAARQAYADYPFVEAHIENIRTSWDEVASLLRT